MFYLMLNENESSYFRIIACVVMVLFIYSTILQSKNILHMLQLSSYNVDQYKIWKKKNKKFFTINKVLGIVTLIFILPEIAGIVFSMIYEEIGLAILAIIFFPFIFEIIVSIFSLLIIIKFFKNKKKKKELKYTDRIKRNIICNVIIYILLTVMTVLIFDDLLVMIEAFFMALIVVFAPSITYLSFRIMLPIENGFKKSFMKKGSEKLKSNANTRVVGITGSFGKTSVKNFLYQVLIKKYNTCKTPESYNTPMGVVITINEYLKSYDDIFICEMGARRIGDIKEICDIVYPHDAIVTEVGAMHFDTFINIENVLKTKMELVDSVVENMAGRIKCVPYNTNANKCINEDEQCRGRVVCEKCRSATFLDEQRSSSFRMLENIILLNGDNECRGRIVCDPQNKITDDKQCIGEQCRGRIVCDPQNDKTKDDEDINVDEQCRGRVVCEKCRRATFLDEQRSSSSRMLENIILLNGDNEYIRRYVSEKNYDKEILDNIYFVGENRDNDFYVSDIKCSKDGSSFALNVCSRCIKNDDEGDALYANNVGDILHTNNVGDALQASDVGDALYANNVGDVSHINNVGNALQASNVGDALYASRNKNYGYKKYIFTTKLIGKNNIKDIAFAIAYAVLKNVAMDEIVSAVKSLEQVKNRLELINVNDNTILINDAYNSNPVGAKAAIDTVSLFDGYKKIIVTPGMVELGDKQYEKNQEMAKYASEYMDEVIVVGDTNKDALMNGAGDKALFIKEEKDAIAYAMQQDDKKIILLENDLTDNY